MSRNLLKPHRIFRLDGWLVAMGGLSAAVSWEARGRWIVERLAWLLVAATLLGHGLMAWSTGNFP